MKKNIYKISQIIFSFLIVSLFIACEKEKEVFIVLNKTGQQTVEMGDSLQFTADVQVVGDWELNTNITWSSTNEKVGTINEKGLFLALDTGKTEIKAALSNGKYALTEVTVSMLSAKSIKLSTETLYMEVNGKDSVITATVDPESVIDMYGYEWTLQDSTIIKIDSVKRDSTQIKAYINPLKRGKSNITLKVGKTEVTCKVITLDKINIETKEKYALVNGNEFEISAKLNDKLVNEADFVEWKSTNENVLKVNLIRQSPGKSLAKVKPLNEGEAMLIVSTGGTADTCKVHVGATVELSWLKDKSLLLKSLTLYLGETYELPVYATVSPDNNYYIDNLQYSWKTDAPELLTIIGNRQNPENKKSNICTLKAGQTEGTANITVNSRGKTITTLVTIKDRNKINVEGISLDKSTATVNKNSFIVLTADVLPKGVAAVWPVKWSSSNIAVATVDETGKVTGLQAGKATITARAKDKVATCEITVMEVVNGILIETDSRNTLMVGDTEKWSATINPATAAAVYPTKWTSSNPNIAEIDKNGKITAKAIGTATITAEAGGKESTRDISVVEIKSNVNFGNSFNAAGYVLLDKKLSIKVEDEGGIFDFDFMFKNAINNLPEGLYRIGIDIPKATIVWNEIPQVKANISSGTLEIKAGSSSYSRIFVFDLKVNVSDKTILIKGTGEAEEI